MWLLPTGLASDAGRRFSRAQMDPAQAAFLSPRRGSPAAGPSQELGNATAGTTEPLQLLCGCTQRVSLTPGESRGTTKEL